MGNIIDLDFEKEQDTHNMYFFKIILAEKKIEIECLYKNVFYQCKEYLSKFDKPDIIIKSVFSELYDDTVICQRHDSFTDAYKKIWTDYVSYESMCIYKKIALELLSYDILLLHGAAIAVDNKCYIFTAPSGTGKTTHIMNWRKMIPETIIVNGDKPLVNVKKRLVYGTPWCGKEKMNTNTAVPLAGIVFLVRGENNSIEPICFKEMLPTYLQQTYIPDDQALARKAYTLIGQLKDIPCYQLTCNMDKESALVAYRGLYENY